jgi:hypothetical protein
VKDRSGELKLKGRWILMSDGGERVGVVIINPGTGEIGANFPDLGAG